jgi:hypothetical protein
MPKNMDIKGLQDYKTLSDFAENKGSSKGVIIICLVLSLCSLALPLITQLPFHVSLILAVFWLCPILFGFSKVKASARNAKNELKSKPMVGQIKLVRQRTVDDSPQITIKINKTTWHLFLNPGEEGADKLTLNKSYTCKVYLDSNKKPRLVHVHNRLIWNIFFIQEV